MARNLVSSPHSSIGQISTPSSSSYSVGMGSTGSARCTPHMVPIASGSPSPRHHNAPSLAPLGTCQSIPENEPLRNDESFSGVPLLSPMIPPGEGNTLRGMENSVEELLPFHHYNSQDIIYEQPQRRVKIVGDKYLKGEMLGEGSYSRVKEMLDLQTLCRRAVKIMKQRRLRRIPNGEANVQREIKILKRLKHKNIVNLIETFEDTEKQKLYVVLEYCVGGLQEMLDKAPLNKFPVWQAHKYFVQLIEGLEYIHSQGIVHKDIKPGNLLLTASDEVKITDFGVAEELDRYELNDLCQTCQGSPAFQPPEIASGSDESWSGFKADIWASGVTLFHFTTGKFPFEGENVYKLFGAISTGVFEIPSDLSFHLRDLLLGMLRKDASERLSIQQIRSHAWFVFKHGRPLSRDLVRFTPYDDSDDAYRGTTVLPYLENYYQYGSSEDAPAPIIDRDGAHGNWPSEHELFDQCEAPSMNSVQSMDRPADRSADNIIQLKSRVSSQENVLFPMSRSVDGLGNLNPHMTERNSKKTSRKTSRVKRFNSKSSCAQQ